MLTAPFIEPRCRRYAEIHFPCTAFVPQLPSHFLPDRKEYFSKTFYTASRRLRRLEVLNLHAVRAAIAALGLEILRCRNCADVTLAGFTSPVYRLFVQVDRIRRQYGRYSRSIA